MNAVLPYNVGATPQDGRHVILDLDCKNGLDGVAAYQAMGGEIGGLVVRTTAGGLHIYLSAMTSARARENSRRVSIYVAPMDTPSRPAPP